MNDPNTLPLQSSSAVAQKQQRIVFKLSNTAISSISLLRLKSQAANRSVFKSIKQPLVPENHRSLKEVAGKMLAWAGGQTMQGSRSSPAPSIAIQASEHIFQS